MTETEVHDNMYTWKIIDDGYSLTPRIEYFDKGGNDVTPLPLYIPEASVVSAVEKNRLK